MAWSFRKSINLGPFRVNVGKSGVGYSVGGKGFRVGRKANGASFTSASIPGTGMRYQKTHSTGSTGNGCMIGIMACALVLAIGWFI